VILANLRLKLSINSIATLTKSDYDYFKRVKVENNQLRNQLKRKQWIQI